MRILVFLGLYGCPPILGNYHILYGLFFHLRVLSCLGMFSRGYFCFLIVFPSGLSAIDLSIICNNGPHSVFPLP